jgi:hypothetical protein
VIGKCWVVNWGVVKLRVVKVVSGFIFGVFGVLVIDVDV